MKKRIISCLLALLCLFGNVFLLKARPLSVGDPMPSISIRSILNYPSASAKTSDFYDQLLILDFMNTRCGSCLYHMRRLDSLRQRYAGRFQVFSVSPESASVVQAFIKKGYQGKPVTTPFVTKDSLLKSFFPHIYVSHLAWIYKSRVVAITQADYLTGANIEKVLSGQSISLPLKKDYGHYDPSTSFLAPDAETLLPEFHSGFKYYSTLAPYLKGYSYGYFRYRDSAASLQRTTYVNLGIVSLYEEALGLSANLPESFIHLEVKDSSRFYYDGKGYLPDWLQFNGSYCYQSVLPLSFSDTLLKQRLLSDLDLYLGLHGRIERKKVACIILRSEPSGKDTTVQREGRKAQVNNIVFQKNRLRGGQPWIDEVLNGKDIFLPMPADLQDMDVARLNSYFQPLGYTLTEEEREVSFLVIRDATSNSQPPLFAP